MKRFVVTVVGGGVSGMILLCLLLIPPALTQAATREEITVGAIGVAVMGFMLGAFFGLVVAIMVALFRAGRRAGEQFAEGFHEARAEDLASQARVQDAFRSSAADHFAESQRPVQRALPPEVVNDPVFRMAHPQWVPPQAPQPPVVDESSAEVGWGARRPE